MTSVSPRTPREVLELYPAHDGTLPGMLQSRARVDPARPFLCFDKKVISYGDTEKAVERLAQTLAERGIGKSDRVAVMALNSDKFVFLFFALARLGAILVPVNPTLSVDEAAYILRHAQIVAAFCDQSALQIAQKACAEENRRVWITDIAALMDLPEAPAVKMPDDVQPDDTCIILYTSGTTGFPKGVMHSQRNFVLAGEAFVERMHLEPEDRLFMVLPLYHMNAFFYSLGGALATGASLLIAPKFSASKFWRQAAEGGATQVNLLAAVGNILVRRPRSEYTPEHCIRKVYGAPITRETDAAFRTDFGISVLIEGYGMTEIPGACNNPFQGPQKLGSMGKPARHPDHSMPFADMCVLDEKGNPLPAGQTGELAVRTPIIMQGYYRDPEQTANAFRGDWFLTGDLGYRDADGYYYFVARKKDIIRRRGENISGAELDRVIAGHPDVSEVAAIAVPSDLGEDDILVALLPRPGAVCDIHTIAVWCAERLAPMKRPRYYVVVDSLPKTPSERIAKFKLKQDATLLARAVDVEHTHVGRI